MASGPLLTGYPLVSPAQRLGPLLAAERLDAIAVTEPLNLRHLVGFTGSNGVLVVWAERAVFYTDSRYTLQARAETRGVEVVETPDLDRAAGADLERGGARYVGLQAPGLTAARWRRLERIARGIDLVDLKGSVDALRVAKTPGEIAHLTAAARLAEEALRAVLPRVAVGVTEAEVAREFHLEVLRRGGDGLAFETIVAGGERGALPHARPGARAFQAGDLVVFDFGVRLGGYCADQTVTVPVGPVAAEARAVYDLVLRAQAAALEALKPGVPLVEVDRAAREVIRAAGYGAHFGHGTGHGIGLAVHEAPTVSERSDDVAREGMVVTVEPGIYLEGRFGVRLEDMARVTADGCQRLTSIPKELGAVLDWARGA